MAGQRLVSRHARQLVTEALADSRMVLVKGVRQAGRNTLTRQVAAGMPDPPIRLLDDPATSRAAIDDPADLVDHDGLMIIDQIQLAPDRLRPIKVTVDLI